MNILSRDTIDELFYYDGCNLLNRQTRGMAKKDRLAGTINSRGYIHIRYKGLFYLAHRLIYLLKIGELEETDMVDHINHDKTDNRLENLRKATAAQNNLNRGLVAHNTSGVSNIHFCSYHKRWVIRLRSNGKLYVRHCATKEDAIETLQLLKTQYPDDFHNR